METYPIFRFRNTYYLIFRRIEQTVKFNVILQKQLRKSDLNSISYKKQNIKKRYQDHWGNYGIIY